MREESHDEKPAKSSRKKSSKKGKKTAEEGSGKDYTDEVFKKVGCLMS